MKYLLICLGIIFSGCGLTQTELTIESSSPTMLTVYIADKESEWTKGLGDISQLGENEGMLFVYDDLGTYQFWMKDVEYPLDLLWIKDNTIVDITKNMTPESFPKAYGPSEPINRVLEVNAGFVVKHQVSIGDTIQLDVI